MNQRVRPRDAASLILHRPGANGIEVLLGKRPSASSFMPDVYVFPGGGVESADARVRPVSQLDTRYTNRLAVAGSSARAQTLACAAIRETFEEVGLLIARTGKPGRINHASWQAFQARSLAPDLGVLRYIGRAITPASRPKRFHARFFACAIDAIPGLSEQQIKGNGELLDLRWVNIDDTDGLPLQSVTSFMLTQLTLQRASGDDWIGNTMYTHVNGKPAISYTEPEDPT